MKYLPNISVLLLLITMACEQIVEVDIPEHESQLVLSAFYRAGKTEVKAYLTKSLAISDDQDVEEVQEPDIKLYENDLLIAESSVYSNFNPQFSTPLEVGKTYKITAEAPGFTTVMATQKLPAPPNIGDVVYQPMSRPGVEGYVMDAIDVELQDIPNEDNYFELSIFIKDKDASASNVSSWRREWIESLDPGVERGYYGTSFLKDDLFEDGSYNAEILIYPADTNYIDIKVQVSAVSRDKYLFSKSLKAYEDALYNPFAEPVIIHTNIENGQGIFSMENKTEIIIE